MRVLFSKYSAKSVTEIGLLQLRAKQKLQQEIKLRARQQHISANRFVFEAVSTALQAERKCERETEWRAGFEVMGQNPDTNDVEYAIPAMREVLFGE